MKRKTMIEARRVHGDVLFYPMQWYTGMTRAGEWVPLVYDGGNPRGFPYFTEAERITIAYEGGGAPGERWDMDAGRWV